MYLIKSNLGLYTWVYISEGLCYFNQYFDWQNWRLYKKKILAMFSKAFIYTITKENSRVI